MGGGLAYTAPSPTHKRDTLYAKIKKRGKKYEKKIYRL